MIEVLRERLTNHRMETGEFLEGWLRNTVTEIKYDAIPGAFNVVIVNEDLSTVYNKFFRALEALYLE